MLSLNTISLKIKSTFTALRTVLTSFWLDNGTGAINDPWNDSDTWSE